MGGYNGDDQFARKVSTLSSIPFEEDYEIDRGQHAGPVARIALGVGASLLAVWVCPLIMAVSAMSSLRREAAPDRLPHTGPVDSPTALPSARAA